MNVVVERTSTFQGQATLPGSKSQTIRGLFLALLSNGESTLLNSLHSSDIEDAINVCRHMGADITTVSNKIVVKSLGLPIKTDFPSLYSGNSGITTRFIMPILGLRENYHQPITLDCGEQMRARPIHSLVDALRNVGLEINYVEKEGVLPVTITGQLTGGKTDISGITSQYLSALLIALPCALKDSELRVNDLHERPYVDMTLHWLKQQNIFYQHEKIGNTDIYRIKGNQRYKNFHANISADFSSASYLIAAASLMKGHVILEGLDMQDPQGDKRIVPILQEMGADIVIEPNRLIIQGGRVLQGMKIDANDIPDLLPTLAVIGSAAVGKTEIFNVAQARIKETDRIHSMTEGLRRLGAEVEEFKDSITVHQAQLRGAQVKGYDDHRTVMALSIAGMLAEGTTYIEDSEAINKTFPTFIQVMQSLGAKMDVQ